MIRLYLLVLFSFSFICLKGQHAYVHPISEKYFAAGIDNRFEVFARQKKPINLEDIKARIIIEYKLLDDNSYEPITKDITLEQLAENQFKMHLPSDAGLVEFEITLDKSKEVVQCEIQLIPSRLRLGRYDLDELENINKTDLHHLSGITSFLKFNGLCANGQIYEYQISGTLNGKLQPFITNIGKRFNQQAKNLLTKMDSGDLLIIKNLSYGVLNQLYEQKKDFAIRIE